MGSGKGGREETAARIRRRWESSPPVRAGQVDAWIGTLREGWRQDVRDRWATEAEERILAFERGEIEAIPGEEVMAELRARHDS